MIKQVAFCFVCRLFGGLTYAAAAGGRLQKDTTFAETGYDNWAKALDKSKGLARHEASASHRQALASHKAFLTQKPVDVLVDDHQAAVLTERQRKIAFNRSVIARLFTIVLLLGRLGMPFRGHDESADSMNKGMFVEIVYFLASNSDSILSRHLETAGKNATYMSHHIQNEMIEICGEKIRKAILESVREARFFTIMMDETRDAGHIEQVVIVTRTVKRIGPGKVEVQERMVGLLQALKTTGEALEELLVTFFTKVSLDIMNLVAQCYDGGSNMSGVYKGVQARIKKINPLAMFTHCFSHSLNRAAVNAMNHKSLPGTRQFFSHLEALVNFIKAGQRIHFFLNAQKEILKSSGREEEAAALDLTEPQEAETEDGSAAAAGPSDRPARPVAPGRGMSDTRWDSRASSLELYTNPVVLRAAVETLDHVIDSCDDSTIVSTAIGLKNSVTSVPFLLCLCAFRPVLVAVKIVSKHLQEVSIDLAAALEKVKCLKTEISELRTDKAWDAAKTGAQRLAGQLGVTWPTDTPERRARKYSRRADSRPDTAAEFTVEQKVRVQQYFPALDKLLNELQDRFPAELHDWKYLQPSNFKDEKAEEVITALARRYQRFLNPNQAVKGTFQPRTRNENEETFFCSLSDCALSHMQSGGCSATRPACRG